MGWFRALLQFLGLAAETAAEIAPIVTDKAAPVELSKAKAAADAAGRLADAVDQLGSKK